MCFENLVNGSGGTVTESGIPIPGRKPTPPTSGSNESILDKIYNSGKNVFEYVTTIELQKYEAERLADIREAEQQAKNEQVKTFAGINLPDLNPQQQFGGGISMVGLVLLAGAAILIARRG